MLYILVNDARLQNLNFESPLAKTLVIDFFCPQFAMLPQFSGFVRSNESVELRQQ
jgi:hypothetical protein